MIIQKAGMFKFLRYLGIFCALTMGFFSIVATSEDDVKDALNLTFDKDFDLTVQDITVSKNAGPGAAAVFEVCEEKIAVQDGIDALEDADLSDVSISRVSLNTLEVRNTNTTWTTTGGDILTCEISLTEIDPPAAEVRAPYDTTLPEIQITQAETTWVSLTLSQENLDVINYYLANRLEKFDICVECDDQLEEITEFNVTVQINFDVNIEGKL